MPIGEQLIARISAPRRVPFVLPESCDRCIDGSTTIAPSTRPEARSADDSARDAVKARLPAAAKRSPCVCRLSRIYAMLPNPQSHRSGIVGYTAERVGRLPMPSQIFSRNINPVRIFLITRVRPGQRATAPSCTNTNKKGRHCCQPLVYLAPEAGLEPATP
jgi:hypothetical protein